MHLTFSHNLLLVLLPLILSTIIVQTQYISTSLDGFEEPVYFISSNLTRDKRRLFREDIPDHRPLTGNSYANEHGWPLPGRWSDGLRSKKGPTPNLPPAHTYFVDMLEGNRNQGNRHGRFQQGVFLGGPQPGGHKAVSFINSVLHSGGGGNQNQGHFEPHESGPHHHKPSVPHHDLGNNGQDESDYDGQFNKGPINFGAPEPIKEHEPKAVVHYHPVQYGKVLSIPDHGSYGSPGPQSHNNVGYGQPPPSPHSPAYGPPSHHSQTYGAPGPTYGPPGPNFHYGPPNHIGGTPVGLNVENGFIPSKGPVDDVPKGSYGLPPPPSYGPPRHPRPRPYRFDPFKIFSHSPPPGKLIEHDVPIAIPILAQFHTAKPVKFTKVKHPIHIVYSSHHNSHGPPKRRPYHQHHFLRRPNKSPSHWLFDHGL